MKLLYNFFVLLFIAAVFLFLVRLVLFKTGWIYTAKKWWRFVEDYFHVYQLLKIPEFNQGMQENQLYRKVSVYLNSLASIEDSDFTNLYTGKKQGDIVLCLDPNQVIEDDFLGAKINWINEENNFRTFLLKIRKSDKRRILRPYLQHIHTVADEIEERNNDLKLYMNIGGDQFSRWRSVAFTHPSTFETIAMGSDLLFGPSGTGKSSFVAAMANFLGYDVYDLDLSKVADDSDLKFLLLQTTNKSVIVIEELDRYLTDESTAVSVSGLLNSMDGILSCCCGEERVMVFTMNSKDHVDPALLRPGRVDVHINFPLCDFKAFKTIANSCLGLKEHKLFPQVEENFQNGSSLSPAEMSELMIANRNSPSRALKSVICALQTDGNGRGTSIIGQPGNGLRKSVEETGETSEVFSMEDLRPVKEIKKLYGLLRFKSNRISQSPDLATSQRGG